MLPLSDTQLMVMVVSSITASCQVPLLSWVFHVPVRLSGSFLVSCCVVVVCLLSVLVVLVFAHAVSVVMSSAAHVMADSVVVSFLIFLSLSFLFLVLWIFLPSEGILLCYLSPFGRGFLGNVLVFLL